MSKKKIISLLLILGVATGCGVATLNRVAFAEPHDSMIVMKYRPSAPVNSNGYQIDKFNNVEAAAWLNSNEVLTLSKKSEFKNPDSTIQVQYCSIYNLNTKTSKDFKDVNIANLIDVSPDGKYAIYEEPKYIPKISSDEWEKAIASGELFHHEIKLLNLTNGEVMPLATEYNNKDAEYIWVSNDKIWANYFEKWAIIDIKGKVIESSTYKAKKLDSSWISGFDIKDNGDSIEGKLYYSQWKTKDNGACNGITLCSMDVKTKEIKSIFYNKNSLHASKEADTIIIDNYVDNGEISPGIYNRSFGALTLDENGNTLKNFKFSMCNSSLVLSPDGRKFAYVEGRFPADTSSTLKVTDIKTGETKEIMQGLISHLQWDSTGKYLSFTTGNSSFTFLQNDNPIDTYIVSFDN